MVTDRNSSEFNIKKSTTYRIRVQGELDKSWSGRLSGMSITVKKSKDQKPVTMLEGELADQAALSGVLNTLYELHLPVLSVKYIKQNNDQ